MLALLLSILSNHAEEKPLGWLDHHLEKIENDFSRNRFYFAFSGACRHFDKEHALDLSESDLDSISGMAPGFTIDNRTADHVARTILLLALAEKDQDFFLEVLRALLGAADIREAVVLYSSLPLFPHPEELVSLAREGTRTNVVDIFDAIALDNPFPAAHFENDGWNQMVLKALFMGRPLYRIQGIDTRANGTLATALANYAHERWAAGRPVSPELWRPCAGFVDETIATDIARVAATEAPGQKEAAALVYAHPSNAEKLAEIKESVEPFLKEIENGNLTWDTLGNSLEKDG